MTAAELISATTEHGWSAVVLFLVWLWRSQLRMAAQRLVFIVYGTPPDQQNKLSTAR